MHPADHDLGAQISTHPYTGGGGLYWFRSQYRNECFTLFELGVEYATRKETRRFEWKDIRALVTTTAAATWTYELYTQDETQLTISSAVQKDVNEATGDVLRAKTYEVLWPRFKEAVDRGDTLRMDDELEIDKRSLRSKHQEIVWLGMTQATNDGQNLVFTHANGTITRVDARQMPNRHLVFALVEHLRP